MAEVDMAPGPSVPSAEDEDECGEIHFTWKTPGLLGVQLTAVAGEVVCTRVQCTDAGWMCV